MSLGGVVQSYNTALQSAYAIGVPFAGVALVVSFFMPWFRYQNAAKRSESEAVSSQSEKDHTVDVEDGKDERPKKARE